MTGACTVPVIPARWMEPSRLAQELFGGATRTFAVELWNGAVLPPGAPGPAVPGRVVLRNPRALDALMPPVDEARIAEAYVRGDLDIGGDVPGVLEAVACWDGPRASWALALEALRTRVRRIAGGATRPPGARLRGLKHSQGRDGEAVRHHYDLSNDFYRLFLGPELVYSCAYFPSGTESLEEAQRAKLELVCRKLELRPRERLLDVGCGWGALLAHATLRHGASGIGVTLSANQLTEARRRLQPLGGSAEAIDYRRLAPERPFDKVASIGMMEHVGRMRLDEYFSAMWRLLRPGGLFLNHAIADAAAGRTIPWASQRRGGFISRYIFPDSDLVPLSLVVAAAERAGFEVRDVESMREHYATTLCAWLARLERSFTEAVALVGPDRARAYRLYLASSAVAFRTGKISVFQVLLARRTEAGRAEGVPSNRAVWYAPGPCAVPGSPAANLAVR